MPTKVFFSEWFAKGLLTLALAAITGIGGWTLLVSVGNGNALSGIVAQIQSLNKDVTDIKEAALRTNTQLYSKIDSIANAQHTDELKLQLYEDKISEHERELQRLQQPHESGANQNGN